MHLLLQEVMKGYCLLLHRHHPRSLLLGLRLEPLLVVTDLLLHQWDQHLLLLLPVHQRE